MGQVLLFVLIQYDRAQGAGGLLDKIQFDPMLIMQGQVWRVLAFPFVPFDFSIIFAIFGWMIFYSFGSALEHYWGTVRYNIFLGIGVVANVIACFALALLADMNLPASNGFLYSTVFLAFAQLNPDYVIRVYFILPDTNPLVSSADVVGLRVSSPIRTLVREGYHHSLRLELFPVLRQGSLESAEAWQSSS